MLLSFGGTGLSPGSRPHGLIHLVNVNAKIQGPGLSPLEKAALGTIHRFDHNHAQNTQHLSNFSNLLSNTVKCRLVGGLKGNKWC